MKVPQLSLRELFWLVLLGAFAAGWWIERYNHTRMKALEWLVEDLKADGVEFYFEERSPREVRYGYTFAKPIADRDLRILQLETQVKQLEARLSECERTQ